MSRVRYRRLGLGHRTEVDRAPCWILSVAFGALGILLDQKLQIGGELRLRLGRLLRFGRDRIALCQTAGDGKLECLEPARSVSVERSRPANRPDQSFISAALDALIT